jgi:Family of unknown function (DUF5677)
MRIFQEAMEQALQKAPQQLLLQMVTQKLEAQGLKLSEPEHHLLVKHILEGRTDAVRFRRWKWWDGQSVNLEFTAKDLELIEQRFTEFVEKRLSDLVLDTSKDLSATILLDLKRRWREESNRHQSEVNGFRKRLQDRWKEPLEGLRMLLAMATELSAEIYAELAKSPDPARKYLIDVLTRSHARACQLTEEIVWLLSGGFADGAMARWRTLHEVSVVTSFIAAHGEELAERYILHQIVESKKAAGDYQRCYQRLGYEALDEKEVKSLETSCTALVRRFGSDFEHAYGWAAQHIRKSRPTIADIERAAGIDHLRAHYRMASHNVHANPKSVYFQLGVMGEPEVLLAGPSNAGLADPGHAAAISLAHVSATLVTLDSTLDNVTALRMIAQLVNEVGEAFGVAEDRLKLDDEKHRVEETAAGLE